jgi:DNA repair photolyase
MSIIYEPKGQANEYTKLAANLYKGCTHGCQYCFGPSALFKKKENYFKMADPKKEVLSKLEKDCQKLSAVFLKFYFPLPAMFWI